MTKGLTDWNDLHIAAGQDEVRRQLMAQLDASPVIEPQRDVPAARANDVPEIMELLPPDYDWVRKLKRTRDGGIASNIFNTQHILMHDEKWADVLGYCEFSYRVIKRQPPPFPGGRVGEWDDADTDRLRIWLCEHYGFSPRTADADGAVVVVAKENSYHPVRDYLDGLTWDGVARLDNWLQLFMGAGSKSEDAAERDRYNDYLRLVGTKWMIAAVARVMQPPVKADCVLILEGKQGAGKSTALAVLGGDWFTDTHFALGEKDGYQQMQGVWICELAELDSFNKAESTRAKQFFSSLEDKYRPSYGKRTVAFARQCVFGGTTNQDGYFKDPTGNRRYWPVYCHEPNLAALKQHRDQLWAEALHRYRDGEKWWVTDDEKYLFEAEQEARYAGDAWEDAIREWLTVSTGLSDFHTTVEVMRGALKMDYVQMKPPEQTRVGVVMSRLGWKRVRRTVGGQRQWGYMRPDDWLSVPPVPPQKEGGTG